MPALTSILTGIRSIIAGVTGVGRVYTYRRYAVNDKAFQDISVTGQRVNFWQMWRSNFDDKMPNEFQSQKVHNIQIQGFYSSKDADQSEHTFQLMVDRIADRFRLPSNRTLGGIVDKISGQGAAGAFRVTVVDHSMPFGNIAHTCRAQMMVTENPRNLVGTGLSSTVSGPRILFQNSIGASAMLSPSSSNANFPRTFMIDESRKTPWRSASLGSPSVTIDIDLGVATSIRSLGLVNTNFGSGTYRLYYGNTSPATNMVTLSTITPSLWTSFFATHTKRYWRFSMSDSGIASGFYQIGELWIGQYAQLTQWHVDNTITRVDSGKKEHETDGGVRWRLSGFQRETREYNFRGLKENVDYKTLRTVFEDRGLEHPFFYTVNPSVPSSTTFCVFATKLSKTQIDTDTCDVRLVLDQDL